MKSIAFLGVLGLVLVLACCDESDDPCPSAPEGPAIRVAVTDVMTGGTLTVAASGLVAEGAYNDSLRACDFDGQGRPLFRCAAWGRAGTYDVSLSAGGYEPWDTTGVFVAGSRCDNATVDLQVGLQPIGEQRK